MYKTEITTARWIVYDIFGNIGWIAYYVVLGKCFAERPAFMEDPFLMAVLLLAAIPALLMLIGLLELINERFHKLDFVLPKVRVYRGFGALTLGGILGTVLALIGVLYALLTGVEADITALYVLLAGGILCTIFPGLCFKGYKKMEP